MSGGGAVGFVPGQLLEDKTGFVRWHMVRGINSEGDVDNSYIFLDSDDTLNPHVIWKWEWWKP